MVRAFKIFQRSMKNFRSVKMTLETRTHFEIYRRNPKYVQQTLHGICYTVLHVPIILQISLGFLAYFSILNMVPKLPNRFIPRVIKFFRSFSVLMHEAHGYLKAKTLPESYVPKKLTLRVKNFDGSLNKESHSNSSAVPN